MAFDPINTSQILYTEISGAVLSKVFGCSFKTMSAQMGFNSQPIVFTLTIIEEKNGDFTLDKNDIRSIQSITFGELSLLGIVQSWERTVISSNGTGVYTVKLTDTRTVLDSSSIANVYIDQPTSEVALIDNNIIYIGSTGNTVAISGSNREQDIGIPFSQIIERVEAATLMYDNHLFEVDMNALKDLTNLLGEGINQFLIEGEVRSLVSIITEFCNAVGAEWWVESRIKSPVDDTIIIEIKIVRRLDGIGNPNVLDIDSLVATHGSDNIISRQDGFENTDVTTHKVIWGGIKRKLHQVLNSELKPFWGFDEFLQPLVSPSYTISNDLQLRRMNTTIGEMESALNGDLDGFMDLEQLTSLKKYLNSFWGKKFYFQLNKNTMSDSGKDLPDYPKTVDAGWWEGIVHPNGVRQFDLDTLVRLTTENGRWGPFVNLSNTFLTGSGTIESPLIPHYVTWAPIINNSNTLILQENRAYMKCTIEQAGKYVVITLPTPMTRFVTDDETGEIDESRLTRHDALSKAWTPIMDQGIHYGPWSNAILRRSFVPLVGRAEVSVDRDLVPWTFGVRGMLNAQAQELLTDMAAQKIDILPNLPIITTGQLEVAGIPVVNIGQSIINGSSITEIFIRFDANGVTTRYIMSLYSRELSAFKKRKQIEREKDQIGQEKEPEDEFAEIDNDLEVPPDPESTSEDDMDDLAGPSTPTQEFIYDKPDGGLGIISVKEGGPFYAVRRLNYQDIDPQSFAGGLNITNSYFLSEWTNVRNLAEPANSPGLLTVGTRVTISIFSNTDEHGPFVAYMEQTPQVFSPPPLSEE